MIPIENSSNIKGIDFEVDDTGVTGLLTVQFVNGAMYDYAGVATEDFDHLVSVIGEKGSIGQAFNATVRGKYEGQKRIPEDEDE